MRTIKNHTDFVNALKIIDSSISIISPFNGLTKSKVRCKCNVCGLEWDTYPYILLNGHGCKVCKKKQPGKYKYNIGDIVSTNGRNLQIIEREHRQWFNAKTNSTVNKKYYKYHCLDCGNEDWIIENSLSDKLAYGCNACKSTPNHLICGVNDVATLLPDIAKLFKNHSEAKQYTRGSKQEVVFVCPDCGREFVKRIDTVCVNGLCCPCGDKWSYPNKFIYALLEQLHLDFIPEKIFDWSDGKRYDEYVVFNGKSIIIEMQGKQHYDKPIAKGNKYRTVDEEQRNDELKCVLAKENGIDFYFTIDSRESTLNYIKNSIISSGLLKELNINSDLIDWNKCDEFATSNLIKKVCEYFSKHRMSAQDIAQHFKLSNKTAQRYLNKGSKLGWCDYDGKSFSLKNIRQADVI